MGPILNQITFVSFVTPYMQFKWWHNCWKKESQAVIRQPRVSKQELKDPMILWPLQFYEDILTTGTKVTTSGGAWGYSRIKLWYAWGK